MWATTLCSRLLRRARDCCHAPFVRWLVPCLIIAVSSTQLGRVFFSGQSRWRGGGFGMYSEFHPNLTQVWLVERGPQGTPPRRLSEQDAAPQVARLVGRCMRLRSQTCLRDLAAALQAPALESPGRRRLELWLPAFDATTGTARGERSPLAQAVGVPPFVHSCGTAGGGAPCGAVTKPRRRSRLEVVPASPRAITAQP